MMDQETSGQAPSVLFTGSCACHRITYTCTSLPTNSQACHCVTCRKLSGGPYQCWPGVDSKGVTFSDNKLSLRYVGLSKNTDGGISFLRFSKVGERAFCADCHSPLAMWYHSEEGVIGLALGSVDEESVVNEEIRDRLRPNAHIFTSQKAWWVDVSKNGLPCYERFQGEFEQQTEGWEGRDKAVLQK